MNLKTHTLNVECTAVLFRKLDVFHTFSVICVLSDYRKCMEELRFSKKQQRTVMPPDLVCSFFKLISFSKGK